MVYNDSEFSNRDIRDINVAVCVDPNADPCVVANEDIVAHGVGAATAGRGVGLDADGGASAWGVVDIECVAVDSDTGIGGHVNEG